MATGWDYSLLSHLAKQNGGPNELLNKVEEQAKAEGRSEMLPIVAIAGVGGLMIGATIIKLVDHFKKKRAISKAVAEADKKKIIRGIEEYDASHPDEK